MAARLIALYSPVMQSGKSTVAQVLVAERGYALVKFADPFKKAVAEFLVNGGATPEIAARMVEDGVLKEQTIPALGVSVRRILQEFGTCGRKLHPDFWVAQTEMKVRRCFEAGQPVVIDDLRFPNELEMVVRMGGHPLRVHRPAAMPYTAHPSEGLLEEYELKTITNNGTVDELRACALRLPELVEA